MYTHSSKSVCLSVTPSSLSSLFRGDRKEHKEERREEERRFNRVSFRLLLLYVVVSYRQSFSLPCLAPPLLFTSSPDEEITELSCFVELSDLSIYLLVAHLSIYLLA